MEEEKSYEVTPPEKREAHTKRVKSKSAQGVMVPRDPTVPARAAVSMLAVGFIGRRALFNFVSSKLVCGPLSRRPEKNFFHGFGLLHVRGTPTLMHAGMRSPSRRIQEDRVKATANQTR